MSSLLGAPRILPHASLVLSLALTALPVLSLMACSGDPFPTETKGEASLSALRINHIQCKATHNSYHVAPPHLPSKELNYTLAPLRNQLRDEGVRSVELDVHYNAEKSEFEVYHIKKFDEGTHCRRFVACLEELKRWSDAHPAHHPLYTSVEPKDLFDEVDIDRYFERLEQEILSVWPRERIIVPDSVQGGSPTLAAAVAERGFPTLDETRGRIFFAMDNADLFRSVYTHRGKSLSGRLMFVNSRPGDPFGAIAILNDPIEDAQAIRDALAAGFIVRTRADANNVEPKSGDTRRRDAALASGAQIISTDYPVEIAGISYAVTIPGGEPSRCNPVTAPPGCTAKDIEDLARVAP